MITYRIFTFGAWLGLLIGTVAAQENAQVNTQTAALTVTAAAANDRVRITAHSSVVQMHVEVFGKGGQRLFDNEIRGGNIFDWQLQNGQAERLPAGDYVCVVTVKNISGRITQKVGSVRVAEQDVNVGPVDANQLSLQQSQAIGPLEENSSWTIVDGKENQTTTVIAHDGTDGQMIRGRGSLSFRVGDFFSGKDSEQMRLTEAGDLGIGTSTPQSKLDVAGAIRAERFLVVKPGTTGSKAQTSVATPTADSSSSVQPLVAGSGHSGQLTLWTDNNGTLGDSVVTQAGSNIGIGTGVGSSPGDTLTVNGNVGIGAGKLYNGASNSSAGMDFLTPGLMNLSGFSGIVLNSSPTSLGSQAERMRITNNGNVGIATSSPSDTLSVNGNVGVGAHKIYNGAGNNSAGIDFITPGLLNLSGFSGITFNSSPTTLGSQSERMRITNGGNVGIGTTSPTTPLHIVSAQNPGFQVETNDASFAETQYKAGNYIWRTGVGGANVTNGAANKYYIYDINAGQFRMAIDSGGNVGVGTTGPQFKLHLIDSSNTGLRVQTNAAGGTVASFGGNGAFQIDAPGVSGGRFAVLESGKVGIGTASPEQSLHVNGQILSTGAQAGFKFRDPDVSQDWIWHASITNGQTVARLSLNGSDLMKVRAIDFYTELNGLILHTVNIGGGQQSICRDSNFAIGDCSSSLRYKTNITPFIPGLSLIRQLRPILFDWIKDGMHDVGFAAEDVAKINPLFVTYNRQGQVEGVKYDRLGTVFVNAFNEQQTQIEKQQEQLKKQVKQLRQQQMQIDALRKLICANHRNAEVCKGP